MEALSGLGWSINLKDLPAKNSHQLNQVPARPCPTIKTSVSSIRLF
jgi:hypothetical protein